MRVRPRLDNSHESRVNEGRRLILQARRWADEPSGNLDAHNAEIVRRIQEGGEFWVAHARIDDHVYIRPCIVNFRTTDTDVLAFVEQVEEIGRSLAS